DQNIILYHGNFCVPAPAANHDTRKDEYSVADHGPFVDDNSECTVAQLHLFAQSHGRWDGSLAGDPIKVHEQRGEKWHMVAPAPVGQEMESDCHRSFQVSLFGCGFDPSSCAR